MSPEIWDSACREYLLARGRDASWASSALARAVRCFPEDTSPDWGFFEEALCHERRRWFAAAALDRARRVPPLLLGPMLLAAIRERDPALSRPFVAPCAGDYGSGLVRESLLDAFERGDDSIKAGAAGALRWACPPRAPGWRFSGERARREDLAAVTAREQKLLLAELARNPDLAVRRAILPRLSRDPASYPEGSRPLLEQALALTRAHPDADIRRLARG